MVRGVGLICDRMDQDPVKRKGGQQDRGQLREDGTARNWTLDIRKEFFYVYYQRC